MVILKCITLCYQVYLECLVELVINLDIQYLLTLVDRDLRETEVELHWSRDVRVTGSRHHSRATLATRFVTIRPAPCTSVSNTITHRFVSTYFLFLPPTHTKLTMHLLCYSRLALGVALPVVAVYLTPKDEGERQSKSQPMTKKAIEKDGFAPGRHMA